VRENLSGVLWAALIGASLAVVVAVILGMVMGR
jgi:ABC-type nitrate/sulfonate/bicarbonate transport system permease component